MTNIAFLILFALIISVSLVVHSLREFSRSRLEAICKEHQREELLSFILRDDEKALIAFEILLLSLSLSLMLGIQVEPATITTVILSYLLFAYVLPRCFARVYGEEILFMGWGLISAILWLLKPLIWSVEWADTLWHRMAGHEGPGTSDEGTFSEEIRAVIGEGEREGAIESQAGRTIQRLMEFKHDDVTAVMTPRTEMVCLQVDTALDDARKELIEAGHSRVPVYRESPDDLVGILYAKDFLNFLNGTPQENHQSLADIVREPLYVPESSSVEALLERMRDEHVHISIVLDEYGGVVGLVTMEDILEEIVGDIVDEYDREEDEEIHQVRPGLIEVDAKTHIDDLNEEFSYELPEDEDYETIGGFVFSQLGKIPLPNDTLQWNGLRLTVLDADKRKILKIRIERDENLATA